VMFQVSGDGVEHVSDACYVRCDQYGERRSITEMMLVSEDHEYMIVTKLWLYFSSPSMFRTAFSAMSRVSCDFKCTGLAKQCVIDLLLKMIC
jgi:hypothetical protein